jgi:ELWxxDGT repeat protein
VNGTLIFTGGSGSTGREVWQSDGTDAGTKLLADINVGYDSSNPAYYALSGSRVFFAASDGTNGIELWAMPAPAAKTFIYLPLVRQ